MKINKNTLIKNSFGRTLGVMLIFVMCFNLSVYASSPNDSAAEETRRKYACVAKRF